MGNGDIFVQKLDTDGNFVWANAMGGTSVDVGNSLAIDSAGNVYSTGYFEGTVDFDPGPDTVNLASVGFRDIFIHKMSSGTTSLEADTDLFPLTVYPNPSTGVFVLEGEPSLDVLRIHVYNSLGQEVLPVREVASATHWTEQIDLSSQPSGIYHLRISDGRGTVSRKLVIQR